MVVYAAIPRHGLQQLARSLSSRLLPTPDLPEYDDAATELVIERSLAFLSGGG